MKNMYTSQEKSFKICEAKTDITERKNKPIIILQDFDIFLSGTNRPGSLNRWTELINLY